ncbi:MAG: lysoplasmalogenase [Aureispira sp.]|nr:lysoplasmalogenase [Aureispira sp.]
MKIGFYILFAIVTIGCLTGRLVEGDLASQLDYIFKPLLMPLLMIYWYWQTKDNKNAFTKLILAALVFAWGGDVALMFARDGAITIKLYFMLGLGSFLIMQLIYSLAYQQAPDIENSALKRSPKIVAPFVIIGWGFYAFAFPELENVVMKIAVFIYINAIIVMVGYSLDRKWRVSERSFKLVFFGAAIFMASDLMIGIDRFVIPDFPYSGFFIMVTYILAQVLIVEGALLQHNENFIPDEEMIPDDL